MKEHHQTIICKASLRFHAIVSIIYCNKRENPVHHSHTFLSEWQSDQMRDKFPRNNASQGVQDGGGKHQTNTPHVSVEETLPETVQQLSADYGPEEMETHGMH